VVRREILLGEAWVGIPTICVEDSDDLLALYLPTGAEFGFVKHSRMAHPWHGRHTHWHGHGKLTLQRPGEAHSIDVFWAGENRAFAGWYFNLQDPFRRTSQGIDTLDHELDLWWPAGEPTYQWKDVELFEERVVEGRYPGVEEAIRAEGRRIAAALDAGQRWWDEGWATWEPDPAWPVPALPSDWAAVPMSSGE
jgi:hypothetical protein